MGLRSGSAFEPISPARHGSRREFVRNVTTLAAAIGLGCDLRAAVAEPPLETTRIRLVKIPGICIAPQYVAEQLLRLEGFVDVQYITETVEYGTSGLLASGQADINTAFVGPVLIRVDEGDPVVMLTGVHVGCFELFAHENVRTIGDLRGKTVAILGLGSTHHVFLSSMAAYVGLDPNRDINWVTVPNAEAKRLLAERKVDAYLGFPPDPQELRAKGIGHVVVSSSADRPWSQYFCCLAAGNREFVRNNPVATKRALRAILKATDLCATQPARVAHYLVDRGYVEDYDYALQTMQDVPYRNWREFNPEDTVRFYSLRLREVGMVKSLPQEIIARGTDWRFLNALRRELKA